MERGGAVVLAFVFALGFLLGTQYDTTWLKINQQQQQTSSPQQSTLSMRGTLSSLQDSTKPNIQRRQLQLQDFADPKSVNYRDPQFLGAPTETDQHPSPLEVSSQSQNVNVRDVHVRSMCRCGSKAMPIPGRPSQIGLNTGVVQLPSKATGMHHSKNFIFHPSDSEGEGCTCLEKSDFAEATKDMYLRVLKRRCPNPKYPGNYDWNEMPDLGVEDSLPLFFGVLSYEAPLSLNGTLHNWLNHDFFRRTNAKDVFVQLNKRSEKDDEVLQEFQDTLVRDKQPPLTLMGSPDENLNPGLAISKFCRAAEAHPSSHPNGENLLMFLEKDWNLYNHPTHQLEHIESIFNSINGLMQRGVHYIRLKNPAAGNDASKMWNCPSQGVAWKCTTAHQHRWSNTPMVISCKWFLRYMEPYALLEDPIMSGCRTGFQEKGYCDWEEALQDGRVAWTNSQWVVAHLAPLRLAPRLFFHNEVDH